MNAEPSTPADRNMRPANSKVSGRAADLERYVKYIFP